MTRRAALVVLVALGVGCRETVVSDPAVPIEVQGAVQIAYAYCAHLETCRIADFHRGMPTCIASTLETFREQSCRDFRPECAAEVETQSCDPEAEAPASCGSCLGGSIRRPGIRVIW